MTLTFGLKVRVVVVVVVFVVGRWRDGCCVPRSHWLLHRSLSHLSSSSLIINIAAIIVIVIIVVQWSRSARQAGLVSWWTCV